MEVAVGEFKDNFSDYLRRAAAGEELTITSHGKPVARLSPPRAEGTDPEEAAIERLRGQPWVRPGKGGKLRGARKPTPKAKGGASLTRLVMDDRE